MMPHPVVYHGNFNTLMQEWKDKFDREVAQNGKDAANRLLKIADGECARLPQVLTSVGHTSRWQPGERVVDVARTLKPGTVIANFWLEYDKMWFPNTHGYHAALFVKAEGFSVVTGKPSQIIMFDQWRGGKPKSPGTRAVRAYAYEYAKQKGYMPSDIANDFYVVMVP